VTRLGVFVALALLGCAQPSSGLQTFSDATVGGPGSDAPAELYLPAIAGPYPAVVVLHGCNGVSSQYRGWARLLAGWGYAALVVDSFRPRGVSSVCNHSMDIPPHLRAKDAFIAADYLRARHDIIADRIGIIGFSHGGWTVLKVVLASTVAQDKTRPFEAAVAFYPGCDPPNSPLVTDTMILIGDADDWTPAVRCERWYESANRNGHTLDIKIYPGALHGFDSPRAPHIFAGHLTRRDSAAAADAIAATHTFFAARL
jgi:dienelactone hydrolase